MRITNESDVLDENIIYLNLDKRGFRNIKTADQFDTLIEQMSDAEGIKYLFIDEIQNVKEFELFTLSFAEYLGMKEFLKKPILPDLTAEFDLYLTEGGFPKALSYEGADKQAYIQGVIREIFAKDIRKRVKIRKVSVFETVQRYIINNFGATMSLTNILDDLKKNGCPIQHRGGIVHVNIAPFMKENQLF